MSHHWLLITFSWFGTASLQYINTGGPGADNVLDSLDRTMQYPLPYANLLHQQPPIGAFQMDPVDYYNDESSRKRRTTDDQDWVPNLTGADNNLYSQTDEVPIPFAVEDENKTETEKRNFSPWGGKRSGSASFEHMWSWKRGNAIREPSMPKRVRFSPWGGKRSGQMIYKPGNKGYNKIIFATSIPELTRIVSNYSPNGERFDLAGYQFIPAMDKRHPMKVLALSTHMDDRTLRDALPFKMFLESVPKNFKPGHPYSDVHLKKDGKRKVKFSAWGGKRSPPIIGPIWTPASQDLKESTLNTILLIRKSPDEETKAF